jgi:molybdate transport system regulatory protein
MNQLTGTISHIRQSDSLMLVDVDVDGYKYSALMIDLPQALSWLHVGNSIGLIFKETEVSIGKNITGKISLRNQLPCVVKSVKRGEILSVIELTVSGNTIISAITTRSADILTIRTGDSVTAFINANEIILTELKA